MSREELEAFKSGATLVNGTNWSERKSKSDSVGFCFFDVDYLKNKGYTEKSVAHILVGITSMEVCAIFETSRRLKKGHGVYAKELDKEEEQVLLENVDFIDLLSFLANPQKSKQDFEKVFGTIEQQELEEWSTTHYSNQDFKLVRVIFNPYPKF